MKGMRLIIVVIALTVSSYLFASTIHVPGDQPTIQAGIAAAQNGDVVLVSPGTYNENIDFKGKAITVRSAKGPATTIIDGGGTYQTVSLDSGETLSSILEGFTIRNGFCASSSNFSAGGISIGNSSPTIKNNVITQNFGVGIGVYYGAPLIINNQITKTTNGSGTSCSPADGSGILLYGQGGQYGQGSVQIIGNEISHNVASPDGNGAGIYLWIGGAPLIENNFIEANEAGSFSSGGGITMQNSGAPVIVQNLIVGNKAGTVGGGLDLEIPDDGSTATLVNNTIAGNHAGAESQGQTGPEVYVSGFYGTMTFWNNIITGNNPNAVVYCDPLYGAPSPSFYHNDAFSAAGSDYAGACAGETGQQGNISADPMFVSTGDYQILGGSPAINAGTNLAPHIPTSDLAGHTRIVDGTVDIGAYEYQGFSKKNGFPALAEQVDYFEEGMADFTVWRPSTGTWYTIDGSGHGFQRAWGISTDIPIVGDFDGDGKTDIAVWRPSNGTFYIIYSSNGQQVQQHWGTNGDIPVLGDYDGDGKTDYAVFRPSTGTWYVVLSSTGQVVSQKWGTNGDIPVPGDYDGDGKTDYAVFRPSNGTFYIIYSSNGQQIQRRWGMQGDIPIPGDYDGDGKTDIAVWRPSNGTFYVIYSSTGEQVSKQWGENGDVPVPRDYDGDGKTDYAVWRPSDGTWYVIYSSDGQAIEKQWGVSTDIPMNKPVGQ